MAKVTASSANAPKGTKVSRPGVHSKTVSSKLKSSKNYKKKYVGQGGKR
jgi:hypothetical protein